MKKIILFILMCSLQSIFAQSITLLPNQNLSTEYGSSQSSFLGRKAGGSSASPTAIANNSIITTLRGAGYYNSTNNYESAIIQFKATENHTTTASGTKIQFFNTPNNTVSMRERMVINHDGKIGINETTPLSLLHITETPTTTSITPYSGSLISLENNGTTKLSMLSNSTSSINLGNSLGTNIFAKGSINYNTSSQFGDYMNFSTSALGYGSPTLVVRVDGVNIGLGASSMNINNSSELSVNGDYRLSKKITLNNSQTWNNLDLQGSSVIKGVCTGCTTANDITITGIAGGVDGKLVYIYADGARIHLRHYNSSSLEANRLILSYSTDINVWGAILIYDGTANYWRLIDYIDN